MATLIAIQPAYSEASLSQQERKGGAMGTSVLSENHRILQQASNGSNQSSRSRGSEVGKGSKGGKDSKVSIGSKGSKQSNRSNRSNRSKNGSDDVKIYEFNHGNSNENLFLNINENGIKLDVKGKYGEGNNTIASNNNFENAIVGTDEGPANSATKSKESSQNSSEKRRRQKIQVFGKVGSDYLNDAHNNDDFRNAEEEKKDDSDKYQEEEDEDKENSTLGLSLKVSHSKSSSKASHKSNRNDNSNKSKGSSKNSLSNTSSGNSGHSIPSNNSNMNQFWATLSVHAASAAYSAAYDTAYQTAYDSAMKHKMKSKTKGGEHATAASNASTKAASKLAAKAATKTASKIADRAARSAANSLLEDGWTMNKINEERRRAREDLERKARSNGEKFLGSQKSNGSGSSKSHKHLEPMRITSQTVRNAASKASIAVLHSGSKGDYKIDVAAVAAVVASAVLRQGNVQLEEMNRVNSNTSNSRKDAKDRERMGELKHNHSRGLKNSLIVAEDGESLLSSITSNSYSDTSSITNSLNTSFFRSNNGSSSSASSSFTIDECKSKNDIKQEKETENNGSVNGKDTEHKLKKLPYMSASTLSVPSSTSNNSSNKFLFDVLSKKVKTDKYTADMTVDHTTDYSTGFATDWDESVLPMSPVGNYENCDGHDRNVIREGFNRDGTGGPNGFDGSNSYNFDATNLPVVSNITDSCASIQTEPPHEEDELVLPPLPSIPQPSSSVAFHAVSTGASTVLHGNHASSSKPSAVDDHNHAPGGVKYHDSSKVLRDKLNAFRMEMDLTPFSSTDSVKSDYSYQHNDQFRQQGGFQGSLPPREHQGPVGAYTDLEAYYRMLSERVAQSPHLPDSPHPFRTAQPPQPMPRLSAMVDTNQLCNELDEFNEFNDSHSYSTGESSHSNSSNFSYENGNRSNIPNKSGSTTSVQHHGYGNASLDQLPLSVESSVSVQHHAYGGHAGETLSDNLESPMSIATSTGGSNMSQSFEEDEMNNYHPNIVSKRERDSSEVKRLPPPCLKKPSKAFPVYPVEDVHHYNHSFDDTYFTEEDNTTISTLVGVCQIVATTTEDSGDGSVEASIEASLGNAVGSVTDVVGCGLLNLEPSTSVREEDVDEVEEVDTGAAQSIEVILLGDDTEEVNSSSRKGLRRSLRDKLKKSFKSFRTLGKKLKRVTFASEESLEEVQVFGDDMEEKARDDDAVQVPDDKDPVDDDVQIETNDETGKFVSSKKGSRRSLLQGYLLKKTSKFRKSSRIILSRSITRSAASKSNCFLEDGKDFDDEVPALGPESLKLNRTEQETAEDTINGTMNDTGQIPSNSPSLNQPVSGPQEEEDESTEAGSASRGDASKETNSQSSNRSRDTGPHQETDSAEKSNGHVSDNPSTEESGNDAESVVLVASSTYNTWEGTVSTMDKSYPTTSDPYESSTKDGEQGWVETILDRFILGDPSRDDSTQLTQETGFRSMKSMRFL